MKTGQTLVGTACTLADGRAFDKRQRASGRRRRSASGWGAAAARARRPSPAPPRRIDPTGRRWPVALALVLIGSLVAPSESRAQAPDEDWRSLETTNFVVTFPAELEDLARRAAERAERAYERLRVALVEPPDGKIDLIVTDHDDQSNGFATLFPSNRVTIFARPPVDEISLQYFDDWLEVLITHELVHTFHLDHSSALGDAIRRVMGRYPSPWPLFPEVSLPTWVKEGMATYYESALTESGRTSGTYHEMILRTAALEGRFETLDQVAGSSPLWPDGTRPYIYGSKFFEYLVDRHGPDAVRAFVDAVAGQWVPYRVNAAARKALGTSFTDEWEGFRARYELAGERVGRGADGNGFAQPESVIDDGRFAFYPQVSPDGTTLALSRSDGATNSQIRLVNLNGGRARKLTRTNAFATFAWAPDGSIVFQQIEDVDPYRTRNDLYRVRPDGSVLRLTEGERLKHPTVAPDGSVAVAVQDGGGANRLVEVDLATGAVRPLTAFFPDELWASPRLSPDGQWIAASRWRPGGLMDIVVLDRAGTLALEVTADRAVDTAPWWAPDGRSLVWASDRSGVPNLYGVRIDPSAGTLGPLRQVTALATGAAQPSIDPAGRWLYFTAYHADGWHVERVPFDPDSWEAPAPLDARFESGGRTAAERFNDRVDGAVRDYSAGSSLLPRYWEPLYLSAQNVRRTDVVGPSFGVGIAGRDLVGRHGYALGLYYEPEFGRVQGGATYAYAGMGVPILSFSANQFYDADPAAVQVDDSTTRPVFVVEQERRLFATLDFPRQRRRSFASFSVSGGLVRTVGEIREPDLTVSRTVRLLEPEHTAGEARVSLVLSNVQGHAYSISGEDGLSLSATGRSRFEPGLGSESKGVPGRDNSLDEVVGVARAFKAFSGPGYARHVLALRLSGGAAKGPDANRFHYDLGGAPGQPEGLTGLGLFGGSRLLLPLRGYPEDIRSGRFAWSFSAEYRFPIAWIHRGLGTFPLYFDRVSGSLFLDMGDAWGGLDGFEPDNPRRDPLIGTGGELTLRLAPFWLGSLDLRLGVGVPLRESAGTQAWLRIGRAF